MAKPTYQRDGAKVRRNLTVTDDGVLVTTKPCKIQVPKRYLERNLASVGSEVYILGIFGLIMEDQYYSVSMADAMVRILPASTDTVDVDGEQYLEFSFAAGDQLFNSLDLVQNDVLMYYIYDECVAKGRQPWYMNYVDSLHLFDSARAHGGTDLGNHAILNLIISTTARNPQDLTVMYRHTVQSMADVVARPPTIVPFRSVVYNTPNTLSKLIGAHFGDSLSSALVHPTDKVERIEELLRA